MKTKAEKHIAHIVYKWGTKNKWPDIKTNIFPEGWPESYIHEYFLQFNRKFNKGKDPSYFNNFFDE